MTTVRLGDICQQARESVKPGERPDLRYIGLESIESGSGLFIDGILSKTPEIPLANSFRFGPEHVLYGKLRPYLNKVATPTFEGKCSTEIIPLLPSAGVNRAFLGYFLRNQKTVESISAKTAGARMPRADMDFVFSLTMLLPPLPEQRRIVDLLTRAESIVRLRREAEKKAGELIPALFNDMFGDPATNPKGWPTASLGDLIVNGPTNGLYKHSSFYGTGTPILRIDAFYDGRVTDLANLKRLRVDASELSRFALSKDDLIINRVNSPEYLGKSAWIPELPEPIVFESNMMRFAVDLQRAAPRFVIQLLQTGHAKAHFLANAKHAINQSSINQQDVKSLRVTVPNLDLQKQFCQRCNDIVSIQSQQSTATTKAQATFDALLARCFAPTAATEGGSSD
jgi:type I restriction enzyme, S subunit